MISKLTSAALDNRWLVLVAFIAVMGWGVYAFHQLPVEAYPDVADLYVQVISQWPGHAAEEVEQQITVPVETELNGIPNLEHIRSISIFGLSVVTVTFTDAANDAITRDQVYTRIAGATLPAGVSPQLSPDSSAAGQIQFYTLQSSNPAYDLLALKSLETWTVEKDLKSVPGVADVSGFGGLTKQYQIIANPDQLVAYGLTLPQVEAALAGNNANTGGGFIELGAQAFDIRGVGLLGASGDPDGDIAATVIANVNGHPIRVGDVATVQIGHAVRLGKIGETIRRSDGHLLDNDDVVEGIVALQKGDDASTVLPALHTEEDVLNRSILPAGVRLVPYLDRSDLIHLTTYTVLDNLARGMVLVIVVLFLFLGDARGALIVALTIPFSLLFAASCLQWAHVPANLLSLGALDFGMVVDGSVVMVENILRQQHLMGAGPSAAAPRVPLTRAPGRGPGEPQPSPRGAEAAASATIIAEAVREVQKPVFFAVLLIIVAYVPIFSLQEVEGKLFRPMALTVTFALAGALIFALFVAPALISFFGAHTREWRNPALEWLTRGYRKLLAPCVRRPLPVSLVALATFAALGTAVAHGAIGSEFLPHLDEGAIWARGTLAPSIGPTEAAAIMRRARLLLASFPEVTECVSQMGRPDDGTDTASFSDTEYFVGLKSESQWPAGAGDKQQLIAAMDRQLSQIPGVIWNYSQPIEDNVDEAVSGVKGELALKLIGPDLPTLERLAERLKDAMAPVPGITDLGIFHEMGQPNLTLTVDRQAAARWGLSVNAVEDAIQAAVGGEAVTQVLQGEQRYDVVVRYPQADRDTPAAIAAIRLLVPNGERVSLAQLSHMQETEGPSSIYREANARYIAIKYSVRGRDLGSTVAQAQQAVARIHLPQGYRLSWAGEYASEQRANRRLELVIPATVLVIFLLLYAAFRSVKWSLLVLANIPMAATGGLLALLITGTPFSVSSGVGFLAVFGVSVLTGVVMVSYINHARLGGAEAAEAALEGAVRLLRPILITVLVASLGLLPAALSHGIGSDAQRPFAIVIVGGLAVDLLMAVFLLPAWYAAWASTEDVLNA